jgi:hypothetical protein
MLCGRVVTVVVLSAGLVGLTAVSASAQRDAHPSSVPKAPATSTAPTPAPTTAAKPSSSPGHAPSPGASGAAKPAGAAKLAGPATPAAASQPNVRAVVARIHERIAAEVASDKKGTVAGPAGTAVSPRPHRIRLEWRLTLDWPAELRD